MATRMGFEPTIFGVTGQRSWAQNQALSVPLILSVRQSRRNESRFRSASGMDLIGNQLPVTGGENLPLCAKQPAKLPCQKERSVHLAELHPG